MPDKFLTLSQQQSLDSSKLTGFADNKFDFNKKILIKMVCCSSCVRLSGRLAVRLCVRPSVCALTFSLNIFSETTYRILMKFHRNVPAIVLIVLFRIL